MNHHVETLTAEIHVLRVGSRNLTLSIYRQLDIVHPRDIEPLGRIGVETRRACLRVDVVGRHLLTGALVKSFVVPDGGPYFTMPDHNGEVFNSPGSTELFDSFKDLPLIVLGG